MRRRLGTAGLFAALIFASLAARADPVDDWIGLSVSHAVQSGLDVPIVLDRMATVEAAIFEAINSIEPLSVSMLADNPATRSLRVAKSASIHAAVAVAAHEVLVTFYAGDKVALDAALENALGSVRDTAAREAGAEAGRQAALAVLKLRANDGLDAPVKWEPRPPGAGVYVVEGTPLGAAYGAARPWFLRKGSQFRPPPPPQLSSAVFARDFAELKAGSASGLSEHQVMVAKYWNDTNAFKFWLAVISQLSHATQRSEAQNARLWALCAAVATDASIAVFDAKYVYRFWRPVTAIHAGLPGTPADPHWQPLLPTPHHPEYPCAHCIVSAALAAVLASEFGPAPKELASLSLPDGRSFHSFQEIVDEVADARTWAGAHYRNSSRVATRMGKALAAYELRTAWPKLPQGRR